MPPYGLPSLTKTYYDMKELAKQSKSLLDALEHVEFILLDFTRVKVFKRDQKRFWELIEQVRELQSELSHLY